MKVNEELLDIYAACDTSEQVIAAQQAHLARMAAGQAEAAARKSARHSVLAKLESLGRMKEMHLARWLCIAPCGYPGMSDQTSAFRHQVDRHEIAAT